MNVKNNQNNDNIENQNNQFNKNIGTQNNIIIKVDHNQYNNNCNKSFNNTIESKSTPFWITILTSLISFIADVLSIIEIVKNYSLIYILTEPNMLSINDIIHFWIPVIIIIIGILVLGSFINLLLKKQFGRTIRKNGKLYYISKIQCPKCKKVSHAKLNHNKSTEQFTFTCKECRHKFTYNYSDLYNMLGE